MPEASVQINLIVAGSHKQTPPKGLVDCLAGFLTAAGLAGRFDCILGKRITGTPHTQGVRAVAIRQRSVLLNVQPGDNGTRHEVFLLALDGEHPDGIMKMLKKSAKQDAASPKDNEEGARERVTELCRFFYGHDFFSAQITDELARRHGYKNRESCLVGLRKWARKGKYLFYKDGRYIWDSVFVRSVLWADLLIESLSEAERAAVLLMDDVSLVEVKRGQTQRRVVNSVPFKLAGEALLDFFAKLVKARVLRQEGKNVHSQTGQVLSIVEERYADLLNIMLATDGLFTTTTSVVAEGVVASSPWAVEVASPPPLIEDSEEDRLTRRSLEISERLVTLSPLLQSARGDYDTAKAACDRYEKQISELQKRIDRLRENARPFSTNMDEKARVVGDVSFEVQRLGEEDEAIAARVAQIDFERKRASATEKLRQLAKETGLTVDQLKQVVGDLS